MSAGYGEVIDIKNGCKDFVSPTMDRIKIEPHFENRLHDIIFAQTFLQIANSRGKCIEDSMTLIQELREYIVYLYAHIEQLEKDKRYLLKKMLTENKRLKEENDALRWTNKQIIKVEKEKRRELWKKATSQIKA